MTSYIINVLGERLLLVSLSENECVSPSLLEKGMSLVLLYPGLGYDFFVKAYDKSGAERASYSSSIIAAAAFLLFKRGLPLLELTFETPVGRFDVFNTGQGELKIKTPKCKLLYTNKTIEIAGADVCHSLVTVDSFNVVLINAVECESVDERLFSGLAVKMSAKTDALIVFNNNSFKPLCSSLCAPDSIALAAAVCCAGDIKNNYLFVLDFKANLYRGFIGVFPKIE